MTALDFIREMVGEIFGSLLRIKHVSETIINLKNKAQKKKKLTPPYISYL